MIKSDVESGRSLVKVDGPKDSKRLKVEGQVIKLNGPRLEVGDV